MEEEEFKLVVHEIAYQALIHHRGHMESQLDRDLQRVLWILDERLGEGHAK